MTVNAPHRFPQDPALVGLVHAAKNRSDSFEFIHEIGRSAKSYPQLLGDVIKTCQTLRVQLPPTAFDSREILHPGSAYISVLTRSGYDFLVAFFAIRAIGGACVPLGKTANPPYNIKYTSCLTTSIARSQYSSKRRTLSIFSHEYNMYSRCRRGSHGESFKNSCTHHRSGRELLYVTHFVGLKSCTGS
jgi:malonyl-CoA/methylmalonyl-CoA synthetase